MAHVVNEKCIKCKYTDCVDVCPVDCFVELDEMLVIDPQTCIDCALCVNECPVNAIAAEYEEASRNWILFNKKNALKGDPITISKPPMKDAEAFSKVENKESLLDKKYRSDD